MKMPSMWLLSKGFYLQWNSSCFSVCLFVMNEQIGLCELNWHSQRLLLNLFVCVQCVHCEDWKLQFVCMSFSI